MATATATVVTDGVPSSTTFSLPIRPGSVRRAAERLGIAYITSANNERVELSPYKTSTQPLNEDHTQRRSEFVQLMLEKLQTDE
ncbi:hypothetical protein NPIL_256101 [Nephila pilipes]|uniref:Uncharacterized protein n=1 Tax=Nephila pilipes TaxID=299642 RepID=A0A8X6MP43_NEPPI|nr:hypothetical protein NPIL_256101 [Nephila pilipes]